jgi:hypothetical protein
MRGPEAIAFLRAANVGRAACHERVTGSKRTPACVAGAQGTVDGGRHPAIVGEIDGSRLDAAAHRVRT